MNPDQWAMMAALFEAAAALPEKDRPEYLQQACPDGVIRREVEALLEAASDGPTFFERPILERRAELAADSSLSGLQLGPWRLRYPVGEGGMGSVWLAERSDGQFEQQVAVKLVHPHLDSSEVRERFEWERRIQARLDHPNICRILDAGSTPDSRPYLIIPYIDQARSITQYCQDQQLDARARIGLFRQVCAAVHFAHQNLVVHSDIKPGNILVGSSGTVQLVDFGIARLLTATSAATGAQHGLTPGYASPEQLAGLAPTTLSDVYALGVLLGRLLDTSVGNARLLKDLAAISQKATAAEPLQRYASAQALDEDLSRLLADRPLAACPSSPGYVFRLFMRRHRWPASGLAALLFGLLGMVGTMAVMNTRIAEQAEQVALERDRAEATAEFWARLFQQTDPMTARQTSREVDKLLDRAVAELSERPDLEPDARARLLGVISTAQWNLGENAAARTTAEAGIGLLEASDAPARTRALAYAHLANIAIAQFDVPSARKAIDQALVWNDRSGRLDTLDLAHVLSAEALVLDEEGRIHEAAERMERIIDLRGQLPLEQVIVEQASAHGNLAYMYFRISNRSEDGEAWLSRADEHVRISLDLLSRHFGPDHPRLVYMYNAAGVLSRARSQPREALAQFTRARTVLTAVEPHGHEQIANVELRIGQTQLDLMNLSEATRAFETVLMEDESILPAQHPFRIDALIGLTRCRWLDGQRRLARKHLDELATLLPTDHQATPRWLWHDLLNRQLDDDPVLMDPDWLDDFYSDVLASGDRDLLQYIARIQQGVLP
jgi:eukaryotic-like serine/threonine-protein kinase